MHPTQTPIIRRRVHIEFDGGNERAWLALNNGIEDLLNALSYYFEPSETFFIQSVQHYQDHISDAALKGEVGNFIYQEAMHTKQHNRCNKVMDHAHPHGPPPWAPPGHMGPPPWVRGPWHLHGPPHHHRRDELLDLMYAWNDMADRIDNLMRGQRELLANVSHELRSPRARVRLALELLPRDTDSEYRLHEIEADLGELDRLIEDVLITSRLQATGLPTHPTELPLRPLLEQVIERARSHPQTAALELRLDLEPGADLTAFVDGNLLKRAIGNLIENAGKYGAPPIIVRARQRADAVEISVEDHGAGIPPGEREQVLEPFYRADRAHTPSPTGAHRGDKQGFGLGLTLARRVAEAHGGRIRIADASVPPAPASPDGPAPRGCCITLTLPNRPAGAS